METLISRVMGRAISALSVIVWLAAPMSISAADDRSLKTLLSAVVGVRAEIVSDARTARTLGLERSGTGIVIDSNGLIVTVGYVILEAERVFVSPMPGEGPELPAKVLAYDHDTGIGMLRALAPLDVAPMPLGDSHPLERGAPVVIASYGGPQMARPSLVVDRRPYAGYWEYLLENAVFASPPHPLFGGAALVSLRGELLGIGSLVVNDAAGPEQPVMGNVFIPVDLLKHAMARLITNTRDPETVRPWLGIYTREAAEQLYVMRLAQDGPAMRAGVRLGERVQAVNGTAVTTMIELYRELWKDSRAGDSFTLTLRNVSGTTRDVEIKSMDRYDWLKLEL